MPPIYFRVIIVDDRSKWGFSGQGVRCKTQQLPEHKVVWTVLTKKEECSFSIFFLRVVGHLPIGAYWDTL
jgi:hypothetical protein